MLVLLPFTAGVLLSLNLSPTVFALFVRDGSEQAVLSESNSNSIALPDGEWEEVDISEGWADPRINGGRLLDVSRPSVILHGAAPRRAAQRDPLGAFGPIRSYRRGLPRIHKVLPSLSPSALLAPIDSGFFCCRTAGPSDTPNECLGLHIGNIHKADLGDGNGRTPELYLARQAYFPVWGTCWESIAGGHHFRAWRQNGTHADSGAWFIGASKEEHSQKRHKIVTNGYNLGRDWFVESAVVGSHQKGRNVWWGAEVEWRTGLLEPGSNGVNHGIAQDGRVAVLTVFRV
ncbi:hypothetical protein EDB89DRAFT_2063438 [Lactarius sanguifluus]|nr:hypothetical protein EDB89DRAFT_2063438 [Lactarius sanguifluus]